MVSSPLDDPINAASATLPYAPRLLVLRSCSGLTGNHVCCLYVYHRVTPSGPSSQAYQSRRSFLANPRSSKRTQDIAPDALGFWLLGYRRHFAIDLFTTPCFDPTEAGVRDDGYRHRLSEQNIRLQYCDYLRGESWEPENAKVYVFQSTRGDYLGCRTNTALHQALCG